MCSDGCRAVAADGLEVLCGESLWLTQQSAGSPLFAHPLLVVATNPGAGLVVVRAPFFPNALSALEASSLTHEPVLPLDSVIEQARAYARTICAAQDGTWGQPAIERELVSLVERAAEAGRLEAMAR